MKRVLILSLVLGIGAINVLAEDLVCDGVNYQQWTEISEDEYAVLIDISETSNEKFQVDIYDREDCYLSKK